MPRGVGTCAFVSSGRPSTEAGYMASTTSRGQISISGSRVPTAMKFPKPGFAGSDDVGVLEEGEVIGGKSSHSRQRGKFGSIRSWWT